MQIKKLRSGFSLPELGLGMCPIGGYRSKIEDEEEVKMKNGIQSALKHGITHFDIAEIYGCGTGERILGKAIKNYKRETLQVASKVRGSNCSYKAIKMACNNSLKRLEMQYLDVYYIHWREKQFDLQDCMRAMDELVEEGLIKDIGVSNFSVESLKEAQSYTKNKIVANQVHYNLIYREPEKELLEYCQKNDILLVAYRPLELGKLVHAGTAQLVETSVEYQKTHAQVAINYLTYQKNVVTIFKSNNSEHIQENLGGIGWKLTQKDFENLRDNFSGTVNVSDVIPLG